MSRLNLRLVVIGCALLLAVGSAGADRSAPVSMVMGEDASSRCQEEGAFVVAQAEGQQTQSEDVQERGVQPKLQGMIVQGNTATAMPGYVLEKGPNNQVIARQASGGSGGLGATTLQCLCDSAGTCTTIVEDTRAQCIKGIFGTCNGSCSWKIVTTGATGIRPH